VSRGGVGQSGGRPRASVFRPKDRADMRRLPAITYLPRSELTSGFRGVIHGIWSLGSTTESAPVRVRLAVRLTLRLPIRVGVRFELSPNRPPRPGHRAFRALDLCRHLYVVRRSNTGLSPSRSSPLCLCAPRAQGRRPLLRAGCSASVRAHRAAAPRIEGGFVVPRQHTTPRQRRRGRGCAHSTRVLAVRRREADLDRFVAALLALATDPDCDGSRPRRPSHRKGCRR
jgi:hypothetical protein